MGIVLIFYRSVVKRKRIFYHLSSVFSRLRESGLHLLTINAKERGRTNRLEIELKCTALIEVVELERSSQSCSVICISIYSDCWPKQHSTETNIYKHLHHLLNYLRFSIFQRLFYHERPISIC